MRFGLLQRENVGGLSIEPFEEAFPSAALTPLTFQQMILSYLM